MYAIELRYCLIIGGIVPQLRYNNKLFRFSLGLGQHFESLIQDLRFLHCDRPPPQNAAIATPIIENQGKISRLR